MRTTVAAFLLMAAAAPPTQAYLKFGVPINGTFVTVQWKQSPVPYHVTDLGVPGVSASAFADAVARAFATWEAVPTASITYRFGGFTSALPGEDDGRSTLGFRAAPELERVLATASLLIDDATGELVEVDIFFNSAFTWSVAGGGEAGRFDLESIAVHEIGHLNGLGHSAIGETEAGTAGRRVIAAESVLFPLAYGPGNVLGRTLRADDIAGVSDLYPDGGFDEDTGSISGRITKNGGGLFGAHIVAFNPATGKIVGNFALSPQGDFTIGGLTPGPHVLRVEPLDDADVESFFEVERPLDFDFRALFFNKLIVAPRGGDSGRIEIQVAPK
jgi:hypothetical protein